MDCVSHIVTNQQEKELYFSVLDIKYAYSQLDLALKRKLNNAPNKFCFLDDILKVNEGTEQGHEL